MNSETMEIPKRLDDNLLIKDKIKISVEEDIFKIGLNELRLILGKIKEEKESFYLKISVSVPALEIKKTNSFLQIYKFFHKNKLKGGVLNNEKKLFNGVDNVF